MRLAAPCIVGSSRVDEHYKTYASLVMSIILVTNHDVCFSGCKMSQPGVGVETSHSAKGPTHWFAKIYSKMDSV